MLNYTYQARSNEGALVSGDMQADRREIVISALKQKGYYPLSVQLQGKIAAVMSKNAALGSRVSVRDKAIFTHQLATLLRAGMRLSIALKTLAKQTENKYLASVIQQLHNDIEQSSSLSQAMAKHPRVFSSVYTAIVTAAETAGSLPETLAVLTAQLKARASINARVRAALVYPIFLLVVSAAVVAVLTTFVIPKFIQLFVNVNQKLPLPTRILIAATHGIQQFWWLLIIAIAVIAALVLLALRDKNVRLSIHRCLLKIPIAGALNQKLQLARFARTLGSLLNGGVRIIEAIDTTKATTSNTAFAAEIANIEQAILKGSTLTKAVTQQEFFSEISANMIAVGEDTGTLPEMLLELAQMYDEQCESAINSMTNLLGPIMIVLLGLIIGFVVMAILLPIFETSTMIA